MLYRQIVDWLCPVILEQEEKIETMKQKQTEKENEITSLKSKLQKWMRDYKSLEQHYNDQMIVWETRFNKMIYLIKKNDLISLDS